MNRPILYLPIFSSVFIFIIINFFSLQEAVFKTNDSISIIESSNPLLLLPSATIEVTPENICLGSEVDITFTGTGGNGNYTFYYTLDGNAQIEGPINGNSTTITYTPASTGDFDIVLTSVAGNDNVIVDIPDKTVTIKVSKPVVDFTFNNDIECSGTPIQFTSIANGNEPLTYLWSFGDGKSSTDTNPINRYTVLGCVNQNFEVTLNVTDSNGCSSTKRKTITIKPNPDIAFIDVNAGFGDPFNNCGSNTTNPEYAITVGNDSNSSACISSYDINWGDGNIATGVTFPISHSYLQLGSFDMAITAYGANGCTNTVKYLVKNSSNPTGAVVNPGNTVDLCIPVPAINFTITSWGDNPPDTFYSIDFGDDSTETYTQNQLESSAYYNASDPASSSNFPIPHTYSESNCPNNSYTVNMLISTSCGQSTSSAGPIIILKKPEVNFEFDNEACVNSTVIFNNTTINGYNQSCNTNAAFYWDFGDGTTSTDLNPTHVYTSIGTYDVSLYSENFCGQTDPIVKQICIESPLNPGFTINNNDGCTPFAVNVTNTTNESASCDTPLYLWTVNYTPAYCGIGTGNWTFTNGSGQNSANPSFNFIEAGTYTLTLSATNSCGTFTSIPQSITVKQPPISTLNAIDDFCGPTGISPIATVNNCSPLSETVTYLWSFPGGNPATSNQLDPGTIYYATAGDYQISFSVTNSCGTTTKTEDFIINPLPTITNSDVSQTICSGASSTAITLTSDIAGTTYTWSGTAPAGVTGYATSGNTDVIPAQIIFNSNNTASTLTYIVIPTANGCEGNPINFEIIINPSPEIINHPISDTVCLDGTTNDLYVVWQGAGSPSYQWYQNSVDNTTTGAAIPGAITDTFLPPTDAVSTIYYYLVITFSSGGCNGIVSNTATIEVVEAPRIDTQPIAQQSICAGGDAQALVVSSSGGTGTVTYQWYTNTTDSNTGGTLIPGATTDTYTPPTFNATGTYYFYVEISVSGNGCGAISSAVSEIMVVDDPVIDTHPLASQELCQNAPAQVLGVTVLGGLGVAAYQWYSNTTNSSTGGNPILGATGSTYTPPTGSIGTFYYYVVVTQNVSGCIVFSQTGTVIVIPAPSITNQPIGNNVCLNGTTNDLVVTYTNGTGTPTYQWHSNTTNAYTGGTPITGAITDTYTPPTDTVGVFYYYLVITFSSGGCNEIISDIATIEVVQGPQIDTQPLDSQSICLGGSSEVLTVSNTGGTGNKTYQWYSNTAGSNTGGTLISGATNSTFTPPVFITIGTYYYYVIISVDGNGCGDTTSEVSEIIVVDDPVIASQPIVFQELCQNAVPEDLEVTVTGGLGNISYQWYSNTTETNTGGTLISGATLSTYTPPTNAIGSIYYYCIITQDVSGCDSVSGTATVTVIPAPTIIDQPSSESLCLNGTATDLVVTYTNGTGTPAYQWYESPVDDTAQGTPIANADLDTYSPPTNAIGTTYYYAIITFSSGGCNEIISNTAAIEVVQGPQIDVQPIPLQSICIGGVSQELSVAIIGGTGAFTYQWYSNTTNSITGGTPIPDALGSIYTPAPFNTAGSYFYYAVVSADGNGCGEISSDVAEIIVVDDPIIDPQPLMSQELCQNAIPMDLEVAVTGGLGNISYQWYSNTSDSVIGGTPIFGATNSMYTPQTDSIGTLYYYCLVTQDVSGCDTISDTSSVIVTPAPTFVDQPISNTLCMGDTTPQLSVSYTNGTGIATYQWYENSINDSSSGLPISLATASTYAPPVNSVGTTFYYNIITFTTGGCSEIVSAVSEITINETPVISRTDILICSNNSFEYIPDSSNGDIVPLGTLYTWNTPVISPTGSIDGASEQITPAANISQLLVNNTINPALVTYTVTPMSGNCIGASFEVTVTVNPSIRVDDIPNNSSCYQANDGSIEITISGGVPFNTGSTYQILWNGPNSFTSSDEDIFNLAPGTYTLSIDDAGGCPYTNTYTITEPDELQFSTIDFDPNTISCFGADDGDIGITVIGGTQPYDYTWTKDGLPFSNAEDLVDLGPGDYEITVSDLNNCGPIVQVFSIIEPDVLEINLANRTDVICFGQNTGEISVNVIGGRPMYLYSWTGPNGFTSTDQNLTNLVAGTYNLEATDQSGCTDILEIEVLQNSEISIDYTVEEIICYGANNASITINSISGGVAPYDIQWSNFGTGMDQSNLSAGLYIVTITDFENCVKTFPINIEEAPDFFIDPLVSQISCYGEDDARILLNLVGGFNPITVDWSDDPTAGVERNNLGPGTYSVTITDGTPCIIEESFTIFQIAPLQVSADITNALDCSDTNSGAINTLIQGGTPPFDVSWSNSANTEDLINIPPGIYYVTITDANGCEIQENWEVTRFAPLALNVSTETEIDCVTKTVNQRFIANATGGVAPFQYSWSSGTVSGANGEIMSTEENTQVIVDVFDSLGCSQTYTFNVDIPELGDPDFNNNSIGYSSYGFYSVQDPIQFTNESTGDFVSISWDFGDGNFSNEANPSHIYTTEGSYVVTQTVTYPLGCAYTKVITLSIEKGYRLMVPNAFTPNEDGINDYFSPESIALSEMVFNIYDTWGSLIYSETGDSLRGWDGKIKNEYAENGNYYFTLIAKTFYGKNLTRNGAFVFIK